MNTTKLNSNVINGSGKQYLTIFDIESNYTFKRPKTKRYFKRSATTLNRR